MHIDRKALALELARRLWSYKDLAEACGVSRATISGIKRGASCSLATVAKIAKALGMDPADILQE